MVAFSTAVAIAVSAAVSDANGGEISSLTSSGDDTAVDLTGTVSGSDSFRVDSDGAPKSSPISDRMAETPTDDGTVDLINGTLQIAGTVSETGMLEIDAGATLQLEGSDAVDAPVIADETNADAINLPGNYTIKTAWHFSDDGRGGKSVQDPSVSATAEDTSAQSASADNAFTVSSPFAATLSGNGDYSALPFMTNWDHHASASPDINDIAKGLLQHPADTLFHVPAQLADNGSPTVTDGAHPAHPHFDGNQPASFKFADDGSSHPGPVPHDPPPLAALSSDLSEDHSAHSFKPNSDHHASADREISDVAKDNLPQHAADNLPHGPSQHADNGPPAVTEGAHPANPHSDNFKFADNPADNLPHGPAQHNDSGSPAVAEGGHPAHPLDNFKFADDDSAHPGPVPHDPPPLTALSSDLSGDHGPAAPAAAQTVNALGPVPHDPPPLTALSSDLSGDHGPAAPAAAQTVNAPHHCRDPAPSGHRARYECGGHTRPAPRDGPTRCDPAPVAATPGRISFCLTGGRCEGDAISHEVRAIMASRWHKLPPAKPQR